MARNSDRGQAMIETTVVVAILTLLFIAMTSTSLRGDRLKHTTNSYQLGATAEPQPFAPSVRRKGKKR
jgi:hypothetical protein